MHNYHMPCHSNALRAGPILPVAMLQRHNSSLLLPHPHFCNPSCRAAQHTLVQEAYHELENAIAAGLGEAAVSAAASAYVMCQTAAKQMEELPVPFFEEVPLVEA